MPRIGYKEAKSIGLLTYEQKHKETPIGAWDICTSCWHDNQLDGDCEHPDYDMNNYRCLVCNRKLEGGPDNHPYTKQDDNTDPEIDKFWEGLSEDLKREAESQPGAPLTELEEYCLKLDNDIKAFKITIEQNARETERLLICTKIAVTAIEATQKVLDEHRMRM